MLKAKQNQQTDRRTYSNSRLRFGPVYACPVYPSVHGPEATLQLLLLLPLDLFSWSISQPLFFLPVLMEAFAAYGSDEDENEEENDEQLQPAWMKVTGSDSDSEENSDEDEKKLVSCEQL